ncbi:MAG TPA: hypothetical protein VMB24_04975, partial [Dehalococcoidales bacterium]|nr:hypothetical protein [Dehalococcoidales bacterium]
MPSEKDIYKKFGEYIDRVMAGEEIKLDPAVDGETRADLEFVKKACTLGQEPTAQFQARLRAHLIEKLEAQQASKREEGWSFFRALRQPAWQAVIAVVLVVLVITVVWREGVFQTHEENIAPSTVPTMTVPPTQSVPAATTTAPKSATTTAAPTTTKATTTNAAGAAGPVVSIDANANKAAYQPGETVSIRISMRNVSGQTLDLTDFPPILSVMRADTKQPVYTFRAGTAKMT